MSEEEYIEVNIDDDMDDQSSLSDTNEMLDEDEEKAMAKVKASPIDEPIKRPAKAAPTPVTKKDLDSVVKAWSDEE